MSLIPEFIFRTVIVRGITTVRKDKRYLDQLFRNLDTQSAGEMREFIEKNRIHIDINYPREMLKVPAIVILLRQENEGQAFLGDHLGFSDVPDQMSYDSYSTSAFSDEILGGAASVSDLSGDGVTEAGPYRVVSATTTSLTTTISPRWPIDKFKQGTYTVHIIGGRGVGQQRTVSSNSGQNLVVAPAWQTVPDTTSLFVVRAAPEEIVGQPRALYDRGNGPLIERRGGFYNMSYQIQIVAQNPELTIYLHTIIKSIFTLSRQFLEGQGIVNMRLGASDFVPRPEYQPDFTYMRAMSVDFLHPFDVFEELEGLATQLRIVLESSTVDSTDVLSDTTTDLVET